MVKVLVSHIEWYFAQSNQPYLSILFQALITTAYFGLFRVGELTKGEHPVLAKDTHIADNKQKLLFILRTSKTHWKDSAPQMVKISSVKAQGIKSAKGELSMPCPYDLLRRYLDLRGPYYQMDEPLFVFSDKSAVKPCQARSCLKTILKAAGFQHELYNFQGLRAGRACDLFDLGVSVETIKKLGRWRSNAVYKYLKYA